MIFFMFLQLLVSQDKNKFKWCMKKVELIWNTQAAHFVCYFLIYSNLHWRNSFLCSKLLLYSMLWIWHKTASHDEVPALDLWAAWSHVFVTITTWISSTYYALIYGSNRSVWDNFLNDFKLHSLLKYWYSNLCQDDS